jgi:hypothetical protein
MSLLAGRRRSSSSCCVLSSSASTGTAASSRFANLAAQLLEQLIKADLIASVEARFRTPLTALSAGVRPQPHHLLPAGRQQRPD